jgi:methylmalonyl-CoA epimerase
MEGPIDHIAFRVDDLEKALKFYTEVVGLEIGDRFEINFEDGTKANCATVNGGSIQIFVSEGIGEGGVVKEWVKKHGNACHHIAYSVPDIHATVERMKAKGVQFMSEEPLEDTALIQIFSIPSPETGVIHEIIQRKGTKSFSTKNVKALMDSTRETADAS